MQLRRTHILSPGKLLRGLRATYAIEADRLLALHATHSILLWGPPGTGKADLRQALSFSAVIEKAQERRRLYGAKTSSS